MRKLRLTCTALLLCLLAGVLSAAPAQLPPAGPLDRLSSSIKSLETRLNALEAKVSNLIAGGAGGHFQQVKLSLALGETRSIDLPVLDAPVRVEAFFSSFSVDCGTGVKLATTPRTMSAVFSFDTRVGKTSSALGATIYDCQNPQTNSIIFFISSSDSGPSGGSSSSPSFAVGAELREPLSGKIAPSVPGNIDVVLNIWY